MKHTSRGRFRPIPGLLAAASAACVGGCAPPLAPPVRTGEPIGVQLMRVEQGYAGAPFRVLLDFESPTDLAFLSDSGGSKPEAALALDPQVAHTGLGSLRVTGGPAGRTMGVKLTSLLPAGGFPGSWALAGGYFIAEKATSIDVSYVVGGKAILKRTVPLERRKWTPVMVDLTSLADPNAGPPGEPGTLVFKTGAETVWCDDVLLLDNSTPLVGDPDKSGDTWLVLRRGYACVVERPGSFKLRVPSPEAAADGWKVDEANEIRVRLGSADGKRTWVMYEDGRGYLDAKLTPCYELPADQKQMLEDQQASPAELSIREELGRIERNAPGDGNHDGYAEFTGAYQLKAFGPRLEATLTPGTAKLFRPVVEIAGLPVGKVIASVEGKLVENSARLADGHVLIELPGTIERPVTINVHTQ